MHVFSFLDSITDSRHMPQSFEQGQAAAKMADLLAAAEQCGDPVRSAVTALLADQRGERLLAAVFSHSPFLSRLILRAPDFLCTFMQQGASQTMARINEALLMLAQAGLPESELARLLRVRRGQAALCIALADISGVWDLQTVTQALSEFARNVLRCTVQALLRLHAKAGDLRLTAPQSPELHCGYAIIAMGKLGAGELNYSSDIDLIILFDPERSGYCGKREQLDFQVRFTKSLVRLLHDFTEDGYVFRVDLRLRPDPAATPIVLAVEVAESYYESTGKNWERAAMIKARPVAGDIEMGQNFLNAISPFVWRKNLDFAAIRDVYEMVGLIRSHHGHAEITVPGHNIKLGIGGIREIEFFAQTHQLIAGGRDRKLRDPTTLGILSRLQENGQLDDRAAGNLRAAYIFLRTLEHRLQMIEDEQTQTLPKTDAGLAHLASFMGYDGIGPFSAAVRQHLENVATQFQKLMGQGESSETVPAQDMTALTALQQLGFTDTGRASAIIETWRAARYRALRTQRARELLELLVPKILQAMAATSDPEGALLRFDEFLASLPTGVQLLSLFNANPWLLELIAEIMGTAPGLATILGRNPILLDAVLSPDFLETLPNAAQLAADLEDALDPARDMQDVLDITRRWANDRKFQVGVQMLRNLVTGEEAGLALSTIADTLLRCLLPRVEAELSAKHGIIPDVNMAVIAMGKLGGRELTFTSDLDLIFIYPDTNALSNGTKPLGAAQYFSRLSQRLINALTAPTGEGRLYEVDMRLRPSGSQGPIAVSLEAFRKYHAESAQTWEHMAWTRARIISATPKVAADINAIIDEFLTRSRAPKLLALEVAQIRARVDREYHSDNVWDFKYVRGGMMDAEFIVQFLLLRDAARTPRVLHGTTIKALSLLGEQYRIADDVVQALSASLLFLCDQQQITRLCLGDRADVHNAPAALRNMMALRSDAATFEILEERLKEVERTIFTQYQKIVLGAAGLDAEPAFTS